MDLYNELSALRVKYAKILKPNLGAIMDGHIETLRREQMEKVLGVGAEVPEFWLLDAAGEKVNSSALLDRGPLVLSFYRGSWCPYCVEELKALSEAYENFRDEGAELLVISPQAAKHSLRQEKELELKFRLFVDQENQLAKKFGLAYSFPEDLKNLYLNAFKNDLAIHNESERWELPIPARIIIGQDRKVKSVQADPDYRFRPSPGETIQILRGLR